MSNIAERMANLSPDKRELITRLLKKEQVDVAQKIILPQGRQRNCFPLSYSQQRLWFLDQLEPNRPYYTIAIVRRLRGPFSLAQFEQALTELTRRHESLRTSFKVIDQVPMQVIAAPQPFKVPLIDLTGLPPQERRAEARRLAAADSSRPFVLSQGPLFRVTLLQLGKEDHVMLLMMHHSVSEGWSVEIFFRELTTLYNAYLAGKQSPYPDLLVQYADYAVWQRELLQGSLLDQQLSYWKKQLEGAPTMLELPMARRRPAQQTFTGKVSWHLLPAGLSKQLKALSQREGATIFMLLLAAFQLLLSRYTGQDDVVVGTAIAGRHRSEVQPLIGFFVNMLALRARISKEQTFREFLRRVREACLGGYAHQDLPLEKLVEELQPARSLSHQPLFQILFEVEELQSGAGMNHRRFGAGAIEGLQMGDFEFEGYCAAMFDLGVTMIETAQGIGANLRYNLDLFDEETMRRLFSDYQTLLTGIVANPDERILALPLLRPEERQQMLGSWNQTRAAYPAESCVQQLFEAQVELSPGQTALTFETEQLSYAELNARANQLAHHLQQLGVGPEVVVGICLERSPQLIVAVLAVLKAGGAYLPLDHTFPAERLLYMLEDAAVSVLLTEQRVVESLPAYQGYTVCLDEQWERIAAESDQTPHAAVVADNLAYVMYTSGSTGRPKGVMISHSSLLNYLHWAIDAYQLTEGSGVPLHSSVCFDLSITSLFAPLLSGRQLDVLSEQDQLEGLPKVLTRGADYSLVKLTPAHLRLLREQLRGAQLGHGARRYIIGGENLLWSDVEWFAQQAPESRFYNEYGPTEATVGCCVYEFAAENDDEGSVPIGRPIANTRIYILDQQLQPVPIGVIGELFIGGAGLARGYWQQSGMTAERFIPDPHSGRGERMYRSGDLARCRPDGNIEYCGRADQQVKVRGYRIELPEIESVLNAHPLVKESVAVVRPEDTGDSQLIAYVTFEQESEPTSAALREYLRGRLPEYMVPGWFVKLSELPLTESGKVDRRALPLPSPSSEDTETYVKPRNAVEETLAEIWAEVLKVERVGVNDNFFELGGHSLLATSLVSRLRDAFEVELYLHSLFERPTIGELAPLIDEMLLEQIEKMSEETAEKLLDAEV